MTSQRFGVGFGVWIAVLVSLVAFGLPAAAQQNDSPGGWRQPVWNRPPVTDKDRKPAPKRNIAGVWGPARGTSGGQASVSSRPNDGKPENQLPYTPYGLQLYRSHKALEGFDAVLPAEQNDPRNSCEPLGVPRYNHYNVRLTQILQDEAKVLIAYQYDNRWRVVWTDGRELPKVVDGGVEIAGQLRERRFFGYSVGRWLDDNTLEVQTVGTMPEDRVWLDSSGRPISDQLKVIETFRRTDYDTMEWREVVDDPEVYTQPWETMKLSLRLQDPHTDVMEYYCSVSELEKYNKFYGYAASGEEAPEGDKK